MESLSADLVPALLAAVLIKTGEVRLDAEDLERASGEIQVSYDTLEDEYVLTIGESVEQV